MKKLLNSIIPKGIILKSIILICVMSFGIMGCKTLGYHYLMNPETKELELVEMIETRGTGKTKVVFSDKTEVSADSGFKVPDPHIKVGDMFGD